MPITPAGITGSILGGLYSGGFTGISLPDLARGLGNGLAQWVSAIVITTTDAGAPGTGTGVLPLLVQSGTLRGLIMAGLAAQGFKGTSLAALAGGLATGIALGLMQGIIMTTHPSVGAGIAIPQFITAPLAPLLLNGLQGASVKGTDMPKLAKGVGQGVEQTFSSLILQVPIAGATYPIVGPNIGTGFVV